MSDLLDQYMEDEEDTLKDKFLTFSLGEESFGLEIRYVREIIGVQPITEIPEMPGYVKGVINLRGKIIPVMDVRLRFRKNPVEYNDRTCIVVIDIRELSVGLIVDTVSEVLSITGENIEPPPEISRGFNHKYIQGIGKVGNEVKLILDCNKLFNDEELESLNGVA